MTISWSGIRIVGPVLVIAACMLAVLTRAPIDVSPLYPSATSGDAGRSAGASGGDAPTPVAQAGGAFLKRPLFVRGRRAADVATTPAEVETSAVDPAEETVAAIDQPEEAATDLAPPPLRLLGIRRFAGETRALIADGDDMSDASWFGSGEFVQGWSVEAVRSRSVTLRLSQSTVDLHLHEAER